MNPADEPTSPYDGACLICGEQTDSFAGDPSLWSIELHHFHVGEDPDKNAGFFHLGCLYKELDRFRRKDSTP